MLLAVRLVNCHVIGCKTRNSLIVRDKGSVRIFEKKKLLNPMFRGTEGHNQGK